MPDGVNAFAPDVVIAKRVTWSVGDGRKVQTA
jgi:hypothetical protein